MADLRRCKHCDGDTKCGRVCCRPPELSSNYSYLCRACEGTGWYNPNRVTIDLSGIPSTVSSEDIEKLREYSEALTSITNLHRELIALKTVDRQIESEDASS